MNDPLHDQVPHMVPHTPDWPVGRYERALLLICAIVVLACMWSLWL
jgi:hypothetical protein